MKRYDISVRLLNVGGKPRRYEILFQMVISL